MPVGQEPSFEVGSITSTGAKITVYPLSPYTAYRVFVRLASDPNDESYSKWFSSKTSKFSTTVTGLSPGTKYLANIAYHTVAQAEGSQWHSDPIPFTTLGSGGGTSRPKNWSWNSVVEKGEPIQISARDWNAFCDRINEFREYDGKSAYDFTYVYKGDAISASIVNEARSAINGISTSATITRVYSGDLITADYFNGIAWALNQTK